MPRRQRVHLPDAPEADNGTGAPVVPALDYRVEVRPLSDFQPDPHNLNEHTERGMAMLDTSLRHRGFGRPMLASHDAVMLAGNATQEQALGAGMTQAIVVHTRGAVPIVHVREDLDADTVDARMLALEDNRIGEANLHMNAEMMAAVAAQLQAAPGPIRDDFVALYTPEELRAMLNVVEPPPTLEQLAARDGEFDEREMFPVLRLQVRPEDMEKFNAFMAMIPHTPENDPYAEMSKFSVLLGAVDAERLR